MNKRILVFDAGSTSLKYKLFELLEDNKIITIKKGIVDNIGKPTGPKNHKIALSILFQGFGLGSPSLAKIENLVAIGHRVVYGGDEFYKPTLVTREMIEKLKKYNLNAPLHNPRIIEVMEDILCHSGQKGHRDIPNYAVFDSAFFRDLPDVTKIYPVPIEYFEDYNIRRYGFHGISHEYAMEQVLEKYNSMENIITIHLGGGCSMAAIKNRKPIDTSMGFTPLEGLMMSTRPGDIDAGIVHYLIESKEIKHRDVDEVLNFHSGLIGICGESDMREILHICNYEMEDKEYVTYTNKQYIDPKKIKLTHLALEMFIYRIKKYIGAYIAILGSLDALVFTGRMATGSKIIRNMITKDMNHIIKDAKIEIVEANEEMKIAEEIVNIISNEDKNAV